MNTSRRFAAQEAAVGPPFRTPPRFSQLLQPAALVYSVFGRINKANTAKETTIVILVLLLIIFLSSFYMQGKEEIIYLQLYLTLSHPTY
jgi:hypothetical protein